MYSEGTWFASPPFHHHLTNWNGSITNLMATNKWLRQLPGGAANFEMKPSVQPSYVPLSPAIVSFSIASLFPQKEEHNWCLFYSLLFVSDNFFRGSKIMCVWLFTLLLARNPKNTNPHQCITPHLWLYIPSTSSCPAGHLLEQTAVCALAATGVKFFSPFAVVKSNALTGSLSSVLEEGSGHSRMFWGC